ncbi:MAG: DUF1048 domain-containing protein [Bacilli bacterium]
MNFWDKITGRDLKTEWKSYDARAKQLPQDYQNAWATIGEQLWQHSDFTGRNLMPVFQEALCLLEETAAQGKSVDTVLGGDISSFCTSLIGEEGANTYRDKWRKQLNETIAKKLSK